MQQFFHCTVTLICINIFCTTSDSLAPCRLFGMGRRLLSHRKLNWVIAPASECIHVWPELWKGSKDDKDCTCLTDAITIKLCIHGSNTACRSNRGGSNSSFCCFFFFGSEVQNLFRKEPIWGWGIFYSFVFFLWEDWQLFPWQLPCPFRSSFSLWSVRFTLWITLVKQWMKIIIIKYNLWVHFMSGSIGGSFPCWLLQTIIYFMALIV